jgi:hypothetical protein
MTAGLDPLDAHQLGRLGAVLAKAVRLSDAGYVLIRQGRILPGRKLDEAGTGRQWVVNVRVAQPGGQPPVEIRSASPVGLTEALERAVLRLKLANQIGGVE